MLTGGRANLYSLGMSVSPLAVSVHPPMDGPMEIPAGHEAVLELIERSEDDAGYYTAYDLVVHAVGEQPLYAGVTKIMRSDIRVGEPPLASGIHSGLATRESEFCSLGQSYTYYERIASLPERLRQRVMTTLHDVVMNARLYRQFRDTRAFTTSLMADARARRAFEDAPALFMEHTVPSLSGRWSTTLELGDAPLTLTLDFGSAAPLPTRVVALVGDNGTGKSYILRMLAAVDKSAPIFTDAEGDTIDVSRVVLISYGAFDQHPSPEDYDTETPAPGISQRRFYRGLQKFSDSGAPPALKSLEDVNTELQEALRGITGVKRKLALTRCLDRLKDVTEFPLQLDMALRSSRHGTVTLEGLSSGQAIVLNILTSLIAYLEPGSLVLIDEPEVHLHPPLISALIRSLNDTLQLFDAFAVVATHSPVVVQELPSRNVIALHRRDNTTVARSLDFQTYGASISRITQSAFGMEGVNSDFAQTLAALGRERSPEAVEKLLGLELSDQGMSIVLRAGMSARSA